MVESPALFAIRKNCAEQSPRARAPEEVLLIWSFIVGVAGGKHHAFHPQLHHFVKKFANTVGIGAIEKRRVRRDSEAALDRFLDAFHGQVVATLAAYGKIVVLALSIHVHGKSQVLARLEEMELFFEQQRVGAQVDVFLSRNQALDDFVDLRVHQGLATRNRNHGRAAFIDRLKAFFRRQFFLQNVRWILNFAAAGACQIAAKQWLQHQHKGYRLRPFSFCFST